MEQSKVTTPPRSKWLWLLLPLAPLLPLYLLLVAVFMAAMYVCAEIVRRQRAWMLRWRMGRQGRRLTWEQLEILLRSGTAGTLILDSSSLGWNDADLWWTTERVTDVAANSGVPAPLARETEEEWEAWMTDPVFERWCASRYFNGSGASAQLLQTTLSGRGKRKTLARIRQLQQTCPRAELLEISTSTVAMAAAEKRRRESKGASANS